MIRIGDSKIRSLRLEFNWKEDKLGTIIDILRVGCVVFLLFLFASLVFGCREKAEAAEPNEPECSHEHLFGTSLGFNDDSIMCADCGESIKTTDGTIHIWEPEKPMKVSLDFIPTWPDYIELEKDLVIIGGQGNTNEEHTCLSGKMILHKGTKIYFKDDD